MGLDKKSKTVQKKNFNNKKFSNAKNKGKPSKFNNEDENLNIDNETFVKNVDINSIEDQLTKLQNMEGNKKIRKKIRQLEFLKRRSVQIQNTQNALKSNEVYDEEMPHSEQEKSTNDDNNEQSEEIDSDKNETDDMKVETMKGIKRFVVFVGNLAKSVTEEDLRTHFHKVGEIKSVRIPEAKENRKSGFAFIEVGDNVSFEKTLSMHHTMLHNKRINVLYTNPDGKNLDKKEIRKKNAKFDAMRKAGLLTGSIAENKKRSFRRKKKRLAEEKAAAAKNKY